MRLSTDCLIQRPVTGREFRPRRILSCRGQQQEQTSESPHSRTH